jgi:mono/diheme cytochrome c family protein
MHLTPRSSLVLAAAAIVLATGCSKGTDSSQTTTTTTTTSSSAPAATSAATTSGTSSTTTTTTVAAGDAVHGKAIFSANCSSCHGATGHEGGVGPSLTNEKSRKDDAAAIAWIKNPTAPMPKLYPSPLSEKDVDDVAAYVETL